MATKDVGLIIAKHLYFFFFSFLQNYNSLKKKRKNKVRMDHVKVSEVPTHKNKKPKKNLNPIWLFTISP